MSQLSSISSRNLESEWHSLDEFEDETPTAKRTMDSLGIEEDQLPNVDIESDSDDEQTRLIAERFFQEVKPQPRVETSPEEIAENTAEMEQLIAQREHSFLKSLV